MPDEIDEFRSQLSAQREQAAARDAAKSHAEAEAARIEANMLRARGKLRTVGQHLIKALIRSSTPQDSIYQVDETKTKFIVQRFSVQRHLAVRGWMIVRTETRHTIGIGDDYAGTTIDGLLLTPNNELIGLHNVEQDGNAHTFSFVGKSWNPTRFHGSVTRLSYESRSVNEDRLRQGLLDIAEKYGLSI